MSKNHINKGIMLSEEHTSNWENYFTDDHENKYSSKREGFEFANTTTFGNYVDLDFAFSINDILKLSKAVEDSSKQEQLVRLLLDGKPPRDSQEEMLCLAFFEIGIRFGADGYVRRKKKSKGFGKKGGKVTKYSPFRKIILKNLQLKLTNVRERKDNKEIRLISKPMICRKIGREIKQYGDKEGISTDAIKKQIPEKTLDNWWQEYKENRRYAEL